MMMNISTRIKTKLYDVEYPSFQDLDISRHILSLSQQNIEKVKLNISPLYNE